MYTEGYFFTDGDNMTFKGLTDGRTWNGWECPLFDMGTIKEIQKVVNTFPHYNQLLIEGDKVYLFYGHYEEKCECEKVSINGVDYYAIDGWAWMRHDKATEFYQANKAILESDDCKEAHEYINGSDVTESEYINACTNLLKAATLCRDTLITILSANDRHGIYSDADSIREGMEPATKAELLVSIVLSDIQL